MIALRWSSRSLPITVVCLACMIVVLFTVSGAAFAFAVFSTGPSGNPMGVPEAIVQLPGEGGGGDFLVPDATLQRVWKVPQAGGPATVFSSGLGINAIGGVLLPSSWGAMNAGKFLTTGFVPGIFESKILIVDTAGETPGAFSVFLDRLSVTFADAAIAPSGFGSLGGNLLVADEAGKVWVVTPSSSASELATLTGFSAFGEALAPQGFGTMGGQLLVSETNGGRIATVGANGTVTPFVTLTLASGQTGLRQMAFSPSGFIPGFGPLLFVSVSGSQGGGGTLGDVLGLDSNGNAVVSLRSALGLTRFDPRGLLFTGANLLVSDSSSSTAGSNEGRILSFSTEDFSPVANDDAYSTNEDTALSVEAPGVLANDAGSLSLTAMLVAGAEHGSVTLNADGSFTYVPDPNFNGFDSFLYVAHAGNTDSNIATVMITVNAVNDPPFFDPIPDQFVNPPLNVDQTVLITGVSPGPPDEIGQTVTLTATSSNTTIIRTTTITGDGSTRTLTYQRVSNGTGTVTITVGANDGQPTSNTFSRTFDITVGTTVTTAVQASLTGFSPNPDSTKPPTVQVTITARPIDFDGNGVIDVPADCYRFFRPRTPGQPYNVIPSNADHVPEAPPWRIPDDTVEICGVAQTFTAVLDLSDWITTSGGHTTEIAYVSIVRDPELTPAGDCPTGATCFDRIWTGTKPIGSLSFTTGDAVADKNNVTLRTVDVTFNTATDTPLPGVVAHVYNRNDRAFQNQIFQGQRVGKNPSGALYADIFESTTGLISTCTTNESGICIATEATTGDYLVIVKFIDREHSFLVYSGLPKGPTDFVNGVATKNFTILKKLRAGTFQGYEKGTKTVVKDCTQTICP